MWSSPETWGVGLWIPQGSEAKGSKSISKTGEAEREGKGWNWDDWVREECQDQCRGGRVTEVRR